MRAVALRRRALVRGLLATALAALSGIAVTACGGGDQRFKVGLIIKQDTNPFFREIRQTAERQAARYGLDLDVMVGRSDVDNLSQVLALETMVRAGVKGILITPVDSRGIVPGIAEARRAGVSVFALDTPTEPESAPTAVFATDNRRAGRLIGRYARAKATELGLVPQIAMLDLAPGISSGQQRHDGFLEGFGIAEGDPQIVGSVNTEGDEVKGRLAMARLLRQDPDINVVYTINEPAAFGAITALRAAGKLPTNVILVSVDGGCDAIKGAVSRGLIDATAQQYPEAMAREGTAAVAALARGDRPPSGYHDTGVQLITADPAPKVRSRDVAFGMAHCWG